MPDPAELPFMPSAEERPAREEAQRLQANIDRLLVAIAEWGSCRGCGARIAWVAHSNGKRAPYDRDAVNHFVSCPKREEFRKRRSDAKS